MSNTKIWAISIIGLLCGGLFALSGPSFIPVIWAVLLAFFIHPLTIRTQNRLKLKKKSLAVLIVLVLIVMLVIVLLQFILPPIVSQTVSFARSFTDYSQRFMQAVDELSRYLDDLGLDSRIASQVDDVLSELFRYMSSLVRELVSAIFGYLFQITDFVIIAILLFYFLVDGPDMVRYIISHMPDPLYSAAESFFNGVSGIIWGYMKNQVIISVLFGLASGIAYAFLGMPFAALQGLLAGVLNMIPYFGSIFSGAIAVFVAMLYFSATKVWVTLVVILALNVILGNIITPMLQGRTLGIHPVVVITSLLVCNYLWGAVGMLIAIPLVGLARLFLRESMNVIRRL